MLRFATLELRRKIWLGIVFATNFVPKIFSANIAVTFRFASFEIFADSLFKFSKSSTLHLQTFHFGKNRVKLTKFVVNLLWVLSCMQKSVFLRCSSVVAVALYHYTTLRTRSLCLGTEKMEYMVKPLKKPQQKTTGSVLRPASKTLKSAE